MLEWWKEKWDSGCNTMDGKALLAFLGDLWVLNCGDRKGSMKSKPVFDTIFMPLEPFTASVCISRHAVKIAVHVTVQADAKTPLVIRASMAM